MALDLTSKILVIDNIGKMRTIIHDMLKELGCANLHEADNGSTAWDMIQGGYVTSGSFNLIISDWNLNELSGIELLKRLRADKRFKSLAFLLVTADADKDNVQMALKAGVSGVVVKPFSAEILKEKIEGIFN